jgi:4-amino-4-deoxychorismate lyase
MGLGLVGGADSTETADGFRSGIVKCRFRYNNGEWTTEFEPYRPRAVRRLHLVRDNEIDYSFKYSDRSAIERLFNERGEADDVLIVRNGMITDTSIANIVFTDGLRFYTPDTPLLRGTCRARLISEGIISEVPVPIGNLDKYTHFMLINAMNPFDRERLLPVKNID